MILEDTFDTPIREGAQKGCVWPGIPESLKTLEWAESKVEPDFAVEEVELR